MSDGVQRTLHRAGVPLARVHFELFDVDGVGARRERDEIARWIVGADDLEDRLPAGAFRAKQRFRSLPSEDLEALVGYMESLRS